MFAMTSPSPAHVPLDVRLVATVSLSVAAASCLGLFFLLTAIGDEKGTSYATVIAFFGFAKNSLGTAMLVFGLAMVAFAGITTWLFSLYASFRIAGPMYRLSRDIELLIHQDTAKLIPVRASDSLQTEWKALDASVTQVRAHFQELRGALQAFDAVQLQEVPGATQAAMMHLIRLEQRVAL